AAIGKIADHVERLARGPSLDAQLGELEQRATAARERLVELQNTPGAPVKWIEAQAAGLASLEAQIADIRKKVGGETSATVLPGIGVPGKVGAGYNNEADADRATTYIDKQRAAFERLAGVYDKVGRARDIALAKARAEQEAAEHGIVGAQREALVQLRVGEAVRQHTAAAADFAVQADAAVVGSRLLAEAAGKGEAAQRAAAAAAAIYAEKNNKGTEAARQRALEEAAVATIVGQTVGELDRATEANVRMAAAVLQGGDAVETETRLQYERTIALKLGADRTRELAAVMAAWDANRASERAKATATAQAQLAAETEQTRAMTAAILAGGDAMLRAEEQQALWNAAKARGLASVDDFIAKYPTETKLIRDNTLALKEQAAAQIIRGQRDTIALGQAELALAGALPAVRARELELLRGKLEIERTIPAKLAEQRAEALRNLEVIVDQNDALRVQNEIRDKSKQIADDVGQFFIDAFVNVEKGGKSVFANLWDGILAGFKRLLANLVVEAAIKPVIIPIATPVVGGPPLFGINPSTLGKAG
ncbi:MAG: hypothetical protein IT561_24235, partial [Alphaproteobacteria bacterium]|nr:hypothetical protein [Alphaproteobacteria bacterium]